ncbi:hypothetical protein LVD15_17750 [Fulvivirga maritima]|uniref:hypothetical protein n=1 Tax=Fulvivirga maritima TaxID=2904247 RepID=UPI001F3EB689|nr:hypothetical protein [Fulvivirga maritima]UII25141.1 hypothetical protein LVD15_17750 [Fulvivirga maritima]
MKKVILIVIFMVMMQSMMAQKLSLKLNHSSDAIKVGETLWYSVELKNDKEESLVLFRSIMADYKVGGYEYTISYNDSIIMHKVTDWLDMNERYSENNIIELSPGATEAPMGFRFPVTGEGKYVIDFTYYQDPSDVNKKWAKNKRAFSLAKTITAFKVNAHEEIIVK